MGSIERSGRACLRLVLLSALAAVGCGDDSQACQGDKCVDQVRPDGSFESDLPNGAQVGQDGRSNSGPGALDSDSPSAGNAAAAPPTASGNPAGSKSDESSSGEAARAISEADIIQVQGDRLYALSRVAGLAVIDVSQPNALRLLGRYRELPAQPFEMYLRGDVALVMFTGWGQYVKAADSDDYQYVSTSKLLALDVAKPEAISSVGSFDVPGTISDSRIVGDVLYLIGYEDGYCWSCQQNKPRTTISSLDVSQPRAIAKVDQLSYSEDNQSWGNRSVTVTDKRMYVAGPEYGSDAPVGSTIQVVDISDAKGDLVEGAAVEVKGQISSRWQMDEYAGTLRVISQPPQWWSPTAQQPTAPMPSVQVFRVVSSSQIEAIGSTQIQLPMRETLRSVRFDGPRAYAITAEQKDPLFTIDLSDPTKPRQVGELVMPGFVWHMEPRGERLLGLGFDQGNQAGSITVSLFDVKDLAAPKMLSRVNFGGDWGQLPEDQDRAQKLFRVLDDAGLILVPFSGWNRGTLGVDETCYQSSYLGGVQIIDFANDTLTGRGAADGVGQARRALLVKDHLLSVSDERVQSYDISDRDAPKQVSEVVLARQVFRAFQLDNGTVARVSYDYNGAPRVDFVEADDAGEANLSLAEIDLSTLAGDRALCAKSLSIEQVFSRGSELDVMYTSYGSKLDGTGAGVRGLAVIDASDPSKPSIVSDTHWNNDEWYWYGSFYSYGYYSSNLAAVRTEHTITALETKWESTAVSSVQKVRLRVIDLRDPKKVGVTTLPFNAVSSYSGLIADGETVLTSHFTGAANSSKGRFYVDRFDVSDPAAPRQRSSINVPGALLHYDGASSRLLTSDQMRTVVNDVSYADCTKRFAYADWSDPRWQNGATTSGGVATPPRASGSSSDVALPTEPVPDPKGVCTGYRQKLNLVRLADDGAALEDVLMLDEDQQLTSSSIGAGVVFATIGRGGYGYRGGPLIDCFGPCGGPVASEPAELLVLGGFAQGKFEAGRITVESGDDAYGWWGFWGSPPVYASGKQALLLSQTDIAIIDASNPLEPKIARRVPLIAPAQSVDIKDGTALLTLGAQGVQWLSLE